MRWQVSRFMPSRRAVASWVKPSARRRRRNAARIEDCGSSNPDRALASGRGRNRLALSAAAARADFERWVAERDEFERGNFFSPLVGINRQWLMTERNINTKRQRRQQINCVNSNNAAA